MSYYETVTCLHVRGRNSILTMNEPTQSSIPRTNYTRMHPRSVRPKLQFRAIIISLISPITPVFSGISPVLLYICDLPVVSETLSSRLIRFTDLSYLVSHDDDPTTRTKSPIIPQFILSRRYLRLFLIVPVFTWRK